LPESNSGRRAGRQNALVLSLSEPPEVRTLPLAGYPGVILEGVANLLAAYPKVGKTTALFHSVMDWLTDHRVLFVTEESEFVWRVRLHGFDSGSADLGAGQESESLERLNIPTVEGRSAEEILAETFEGDEDIVVVDTVRTVMRFSQETDNSEITAQVTPWVDAARSSGKTFVGSHHTTKAGGYHGRGIAGGHALVGIFDHVIEVDRDKGIPNRRRVSVMSRLSEVEDFAYDLIEVGSSWPEGLPRSPPRRRAVVSPMSLTVSRGPSRSSARRSSLTRMDAGPASGPSAKS
jgi:DNA repair protein RadA/Sms